MASQIDSTKPVTGNPTTGSVREQFAAAKNEMNTMLRMTTDVKLTSGSNTAYVVTYDIAPGSLVNGLRILAKADEACGAAPTLNVNNLGAKSIVHPDGQALVAGEIAGGSHYLDLVYNSTNDTWTLMNPSNVKADQLTTARDIELTGPVTGTVAFNGTSNVQIATTVTASAGLAAYPIGAIYLSVSTDNPATIFGGIWAPIADDLVLATPVDDSDLGGTGSSANTRSMTKDQMPAHTHKFHPNSIFSTDDHPQNETPKRIVGDRTSSAGGLNEFNPHSTLQDHEYLTTEGTGAAFNVRQKSFYVKMWQRTG